MSTDDWITLACFVVPWLLIIVVGVLLAVELWRTRSAADPDKLPDWEELL